MEEHTGSVEADEADGGHGEEGCLGEEDGQAQQERQRSHGPCGIDWRARAVVDGRPDAVQGNAAVPRERPQHPEQAKRLQSFSKK